MKTSEKESFHLTPEEADYIEDLIIRNEYMIRAAVKSVLQEKYEYLGEDCISEIYYLACKKIKKLKKHEKPDAWIIVASRKVALNEARKYNTYINHTTDEKVINIPAIDTVFEDALYNIWLEEGVIDKLLNLLTPHERKIYELLYKKRLPPKEVAKIIGVSESTIRNINSTIKKKIKKAINTENF